MIERVTVVKFTMNDGGGNGAGYFEVKVWADTAKFMDVIAAKSRKSSDLVREGKAWICASGSSVSLIFGGISEMYLGGGNSPQRGLEKTMANNEAWKSPSGVQGQSPGRGSGGQSPPGAEAAMDHQDKKKTLQEHKES